MRRILPFLFCSLLALPVTVFAQDTGAGAAPEAPRAIPGITAPDSFPDACVSCHVNMPDRKMDARLSTALTGWATSVDPKLLAKAQATMPEGVTLKGTHPESKTATENVPKKCITCHTARKSAPPFANMIHLIHLTGGAENHFLTEFQGQCTFCHKLDEKTGAWSVPTGPEK
ncbi:MAG: hypothetical protein ACM3JJ_05950 [Hyphomicrobiales bacterium]